MTCIFFKPSKVPLVDFESIIQFIIQKKNPCKKGKNILHLLLIIPR